MERQLDLTPPGRHYYVSIIRDSKRRALLLGPYDTQAKAYQNLKRGKELAYEADPFTHFDAFGTASSEEPLRTVFGK